MGPSGLILKPDNTFFDIEECFPSKFKTVSVSCSGGIESTLLMYLALQRYGADNVHILTGYIQGRRSWESANATRLANMLGVKHLHVMDNNFKFLSPAEQGKMIARSRQLSCEAHYIGEAFMFFATNSTSSLQEETNRFEQSVHLPFIRYEMKKANVIDAYFQLGIEDLLYQTHSCTGYGDRHCGVCYCCLERVKGFNDLGHRDKATYDRDWDTIVEETTDPSKIKKNW